jgi:serine phosphatase RsbU (regulator of sigma subunit)
MEAAAQKLRAELLQITDKKERIRAIQSLVSITNDAFPDINFIRNNQDLFEEAFNLAVEINDKQGQAYGYISKAYIGLYITQDLKTIEYFKTGLAIFAEIGDTEKYGRTYYMLTYALWMSGKYDQALEYAFKSLKDAEATKNIEQWGWSNYALGVFYYDLKDYSTSEIYYKNAFEIFSQDPSMQLGCARCRGGLGSIMIATNRFDEALENIRFSAGVYQAVKNRIGEARALNDLGVILVLQEKYEEAEQHLKESLKIRDEDNHHQGIITSCMELGRLYLKIKKYDIALHYFDRALKMANTSGSKPKAFQIHELIGETYKQTGELAKALEHKETFFQIKTEVTGEQASNRLKQLQTQFATEKSEKETEIHRLKNVELKKAYEEIEEKNKNILDSINYAKRIQQAILPSDAEIKKLLPQSFVLYMPKDVVSGDFYWIENKNDKILFAAVDCTGHGVPGAFMSMIGNTLLNEIVNEKKVVTPGEILSQLREGIIKSLKQTGGTGENQDGMDIALCTLHDHTLEYAGANNPLWIFNKSGMTELKADKQPIGIYYGEPKPFTNHKVELQKGDCIYIFTDGYADQVGGEKSKKFMYKRLQETIAANFEKDMEEQKTLLVQTINEWRGNLEQVDDILLIGIKI